MKNEKGIFMINPKLLEKSVDLRLFLTDENDKNITLFYEILSNITGISTGENVELLKKLEEVSIELKEDIRMIENFDEIHKPDKNGRLPLNISSSIKWKRIPRDPSILESYDISENEYLNY